jgi:hypothetical protein
MDEIVKKLMASGMSSDMVEKLKSGLGDKFESTALSGGLAAAAGKLGLDASMIPNIDFKNGMEAVQELMGKDVDGDGKTGVSEALDNAKEMMANTDMSKLKTLAQTQGG